MRVIAYVGENKIMPQFHAKRPCKGCTIHPYDKNNLFFLMGHLYSYATIVPVLIVRFGDIHLPWNDGVMRSTGSKYSTIVVAVVGWLIWFSEWEWEQLLALVKLELNQELISTSVATTAATWQQNSYEFDPKVGSSHATAAPISLFFRKGTTTIFWTIHFISISSLWEFCVCI